MEGTQGLESGQSLAADTAANMAQLCLAGEIVHGPSSTVTDSHDQTVPIISVATGGQWFDNKCSMAMRQPWQDYTSATTATRHVSVVDNEYGPHKMQLGHHSGHYDDPLEADLMATISLRTVDTTRREETAKVGEKENFLECLVFIALPNGGCETGISSVLGENWGKYFLFP